ncbi:MAG TPA: DNA-binding response regulator [Xanthomonadaceae bacterium]|nr:DNA-binding response regulator [Xanthomonadaceae bacterium]
MTATAGYSPVNVCILEDDAVLRERLLLPRLREYGFEVAGMETAQALYRAIETRLPDIVVLDVGLPDTDGFEVTRRLRERSARIGIVMLTGRGEVHDRVRGLSEGADAYLSKPVQIDLLAATLHSLARRLFGGTDLAPAGGWRLGAGDWCLLSPSGRSIALTRSERRALAPLVGNAGHLVGREQLIAAMTDNVYDFDPHQLDSLVHRLRKKVAAAAPGEPLPLVAVYGAGYVFG